MAQRNNGQINPNGRQKNVDGNDKVSLKFNSNQSKPHLRKKRRQKTKKNRNKQIEQAKKPGEIITYVLDTNVIMNAWDAIFKFDEHDVCIVSQVWHELDKHKIGREDKNYNSRRAIRAIDFLLEGKTQEEIMSGIVLVPPEELAKRKNHTTGKLIFDFSQPRAPEGLDIELDSSSPDDRIIMTALSLKAQGKNVILVSNDGNCRVRAKVAGLEAEEYLNDAVEFCCGEEDFTTGFHVMADDFWQKVGEDSLVSGKKGIYDFYEFNHAMFRNINCNEFLVLPGDLQLRVIEKPSPHKVTARTFNLKEYEGTIKPRNIEQAFAIELLMDPTIPAVSLAGLAGTGKTYLALSAAYHQTVEERVYERVIVTRAPVESGEEIGFLPGSEEEKMNPWLGGVFDNLESFFKRSDEDYDFQQHKMTMSYVRKKMNLHIKSAGFMKGRSLERTLFILDETQDVNRKTLKTILTRMGKGSKIILLGNVAQIDNTFVSEISCGMSVFIQTFSDSPLVGHITLQQGERSPFANLAEERL